jgi:hypothetical protein
MRDYHLPEDEPTAEKPFHIEENDTTKTLNDWRGVLCLLIALSQNHYIPILRNCME